MDPEVTIPVDPTMSGPEPSSGAAPETPAPETTSAEPPSPPEAPEGEVADQGTETPTEPATEPQFELPDGTKVTAKQIADWKAGAMMEADYRRKTQELADQRRALEAEQAQRQAAEQAQRSNIIDPVSQQDQWKQLRYQQYVEHYRAQGRDPQEIDWRDIEFDHLKASQNVMLENQHRAQQTLTQREQQAEVERQTVWLDRTIERHLGDKKFELANTPEGHEDVRAHLAVTLQTKGEITEADIQAAVQKVHARAHALVSRYVNGKQHQAQRTTGVTQGGGQSRAPERKKYAPEVSSIRDLTNDLVRSGG